MRKQQIGCTLVLLLSMNIITYWFHLIYFFENFGESEPDELGVVMVKGCSCVKNGELEV